MDVGGVDLTGALSAVAGAVGTGALVIFAAKTLAERYIKQNDDRHKEHADRAEELEDELAAKLDKLTDLVTEVRVQMAAVAVSAGKVEGFAQSVNAMTLKLGELSATQVKLQSDVNEAFRRLKLAGGKS